MKKLTFSGFFILLIVFITNPLQASTLLDDNGADSSGTQQDAIQDFAKSKIVAAGNINTDCSIAKGYNVKKADWDNTSQAWHITLKGPAKKFVSNQFIVLATAIDQNSYTATFVGGNNNKLIVYLHDVNGTRSKQNFCFLVIKI